MLRGRRSIVRASRCFSISTPPPPPLNLSSRCRFYPLAITPAPCCDSIARFFRINLTASYKSTCLQQRDTPSRDIYIYIYREGGPFDPRRKTLPLFYKIGRRSRYFEQFSNVSVTIGDIPLPAFRKYNILSLLLLHRLHPISRKSRLELVI